MIGQGRSKGQGRPKGQEDRGGDGITGWRRPCGYRTTWARPLLPKRRIASACRTVSAHFNSGLGLRKPRVPAKTTSPSGSVWAQLDPDVIEPASESD